MKNWIDEKNPSPVKYANLVDGFEYELIRWPRNLFAGMQQFKCNGAFISMKNLIHGPNAASSAHKERTSSLVNPSRTCALRALEDN